MKKFLCMLLSALMVFSLVSIATAEAAPYKIAIITGTTSQGEEEFRAAEALQTAYPDIVLTATYPDNFSSEIEATKSTIVNFAFDPDVKAIIMCQAVPGTAAAFQEVKAMRDDILLIAGVPQEASATITAAADVVLYSDEPAQGVQIVDTIKNWGVDVFIHYSFPRHMAMETIVARHTVMTALCAEAGIEFVDLTAPDPTAEAGATASQQFILEDVPRVMAEYEGKKVAFYTTNCGMQEPLQTAVFAQPNAYYPLPCCPSPFHAYPASMEIATEPEDWGNAELFLGKIAAKLAANDALGRFSTWSVAANMAFIKAGYTYAVKWIEGEVTERNNQAVLYAELCAAAGVEALDFTEYTDAEGTTYANYYMMMLPAVDFNDYI
ncbi:MAG: DUF3798 domain-containing protein [Oscillospiraceae bacterium]|jgi:hypothetical protein|nr:DUF3798 domain-containing protein [Oscillospiraceae bacterium]